MVLHCQICWQNKVPNNICNFAIRVPYFVTNANYQRQFADLNAVAVEKLLTELSVFFIFQEMSLFFSVYIYQS
jgi:hypothetical protein